MDNKGTFLHEIDKEACYYWNRHKRLRRAELALMLTIVTAGAFTSLAAVASTPRPWYATPTAVFVWGLIAALIGVLDKWANPSQQSERSLQIKIALRAIERATKDGKLPLDKAKRLFVLAHKDPEEAILDALR